MNSVTSAMAVRLLLFRRSGTLCAGQGRDRRSGAELDRSTTSSVFASRVAFPGVYRAEFSDHPAWTRRTGPENSLAVFPREVLCQAYLPLRPAPGERPAGPDCFVPSVVLVGALAPEHSARAWGVGVSLWPVSHSVLAQERVDSSWG